MPRLDPSTTPIPDVDTRPFWEFTKKHELRVQRCERCGHYRFPPAVLCSECQSFGVEWVQLSGRGTVYSWEVIHHHVTPAFMEAGPLPVVMVQPEESDAVHFVGGLVETDRGDLRVGLPVEAVFEDQTDEITLVHWRAARAQ